MSIRVRKLNYVCLGIGLGFSAPSHFPWPHGDASLERKESFTASWG